MHIPAANHHKLNKRQGQKRPDHHRVGDAEFVFFLEDDPLHECDNAKNQRKDPVKLWTCVRMLTMRVVLVAWVVTVC